jgi:hypothetical protein
MNQATLEKRYGWKRGSDAASRYIRVFGEDADRELAEARGVDVQFEEPESDGPKNCKRCGVLIDKEADKCDNCGFIQQRELAQERVTSGETNIRSMVREAVREEMTDFFDDTHDNATGAAIESTNPDEIAGLQGTRDLTAEGSEARDELLERLLDLQHEVEALKAGDSR